ncbi:MULTISPECIES: hypothetical protein [Rhizobium]|uniref:Uncharacterized protein n=1 Tax=Rhizobium dioscoreae TaxID=2653122 RepID=A0ABQ0Z778_9HYPH|nr:MULTISPECIES: hypothetical protein [Rhizobium]GLU82827.1 hypothetical protein Rhsp01_40030 [Rhizobium sp. NBRC 114257]QYA16462.1 hypothetical protein J5284_26430 [Rhizobium sp. AB2/73]TWB13542.1 hypothetical protein FBZ99_105413 [Rhizobium sp. ERR1071]TWB53703.1 hypothetical protein FBZ98_104631 [Rhizobium sp. ERR 922]TWB95333.1 hypothetical protein FBZ97_10420 [Rhizobium sp. ERR 942]
MTISFPLTDKRTVDELLKHLNAHKLFCPGNCAITVKPLAAHVSSCLSYALSTARTAW